MGFHICRSGYVGDTDIYTSNDDIMENDDILKLPGVPKGKQTGEHAEEFKRFLMEKGLSEAVANILAEHNPIDIFEQIERAKNEELLKLPKMTTSAQRTAVSLLSDRLGKSTAEIVISSSMKPKCINRLISYLRNETSNLVTSESDEEVLSLPTLNINRRR